MIAGVIARARPAPAPVVLMRDSRVDAPGSGAATARVKGATAALAFAPA
jgi:hypothetical protein